MPTAVEFKDVHKRYRIYRERYRSLKEVVFHRRFGEWEDRWALAGINLEVETGATFGIIGPNGAGKSTALKLMSRILVPDQGKVTVQGKVAGLLELGSGFQPEYTGRENIYLNSSLLGLNRRQVAERYDRIVEFSELEDHLDDQLRTYSTGMAMRLGFAVAINVDARILLVDETLAVGDESFQRKCFDWLRHFSESGGTIVLVSHSLGSVKDLCTRVAWIQDGQLHRIGDPDEVVDAYLAQVDAPAV